MATETITTPGAGTYTVPAGVFELTSLVVVGGGGGGGAGTGTDASPGGGGGGCATKTSLTVTPGQELPYAVGAGGAGGTSAGNGGNGGASSLSALGSPVVSATGGAGGEAGSISIPVGGDGTVGDSLFNGGDGSSNNPGGGGGGGGSSSDGTSSFTSTGGAGGNPGAAGGDGGSPGSAGTSPGGGGGGGNIDQDGGAGGNGFITFDYVVRVAPSDIALDNATIAENSSVGTSIGALSVTDADAGDTATFTLPAGIRDNDSFAVDGVALETGISLNYEARSLYTVTVRATDSYGLYREEDFVITVTNVNEAPTDIALSNSTVASGSASGTTVGALTTTDVDAGDSHTYSLAAATLDNASFTITGANLKTAFLADYSARNLYTVQVTAHDAGGLTFDENFTISITSTDSIGEPVVDIPLTEILGESRQGTLSGTVTLTRPAGANRLTLMPINQNVLVSFGGTAPSPTFGIPLVAGYVYTFHHLPAENKTGTHPLDSVKATEVTASATLGLIWCK